MANGSSSADKFDQIMGLSVTMSAANTLTFSRVAIGITLFDYAAFIISRIEYQINRASATEIQANTDSATMAITGSSSVADIVDLTNPAVYDSITLTPIAAGAPANFQLMRQPLVKDFSAHEGGGLIVPAQDIFLAMVTSGFGPAGVATARVYYRVMKLAAADYLELAQRQRVLTT